MMEIRWSKRAEIDYFEIFDVLKSIDIKLAGEFVEKIKYLVQLISKYPLMGRIVPDKEIPSIREVF